MLVSTNEESSDDELASLMADPEISESVNLSEDHSQGVVEVGIPPSLNDNKAEIDSSEESFSMNDFEEDFNPQASNVKDGEFDEDIDSTEHEESIEVPDGGESDVINQPTVVPQHEGAGEGDVAQFRQTLASLSRQLELDRLAFLHKSLEDSGEKLPSLNEIASDISGQKLITPSGDCDLYGKRPAARLDGWLSGLSFGVNRRAKKFNR